MSPAKRATTKAKPAKPSKKAASRPARKAAGGRKAPAARGKSAKAARPAGSRAAPSMARPGHARCAATDPFGDPCQNVPRRPSRFCVIHSYLER